MTRDKVSLPWCQFTAMQWLRKPSIVTCCKTCDMNTIWNTCLAVYMQCSSPLTPVPPSELSKAVLHITSPCESNLQARQCAGQSVRAASPMQTASRSRHSGRCCRRLLLFCRSGHDPSAECVLGWFPCRILLVYLVPTIYRFKYYFAWTVAEAGLTMAGMNYNGVNESGVQQ